MLGKIKEIIDNNVIIELAIDITEQPNLVNLHIVFEDGSDKKIVAEVSNTNRTEMKANIVGEIKGDQFTPGGGSKPSFKSTIRLIKKEELELLFGKQELTKGFTNFGFSNVYDGYKVNVNINRFFNSHFTIMGNSGSGKSCAVASILQRLFTNGEPPVNSTMFFFDAYGEYTQAFSKLHEINPRLNYKTYTTNVVEPETDILKIPIWLLDVDDLALLLDVTTPAQLPIIEKTLKLVPILTGSSENVIRRKNDIIARALQDIMLSGKESVKIRDQVIGVLTKFNTPTLRLDSQIVQPGYTRTLKQCLYIDKMGKMQEMELVVEFIRGYIMEENIEVPEDELNRYYNLNDLELALEFALISEGILKSDKIYDNANIISVRLHSLATGENRHFFDYPKFVSRDKYIEDLTWDDRNNGPAQIINFNVNYVDDRTAKVIIKILSRMLFLKLSSAKQRGARAFHIIMEEAHRYVQHDNDLQLLGYNIFERISKEGRKYGLFLALITQRPSELSDTCVSQCGNFIIMRTLHPIDLKYIHDMVPNISEEIVQQMKNLKPGNAIAFGSAFKVPTVLYFPLPNPEPLSSNVNLETVWYSNNNTQQVSSPSGEVRVPVTNDVSTIMSAQSQHTFFQPQPQPVEQHPGTFFQAPPAAQTNPSGITIVGNVNNQ